MTVCGPFVRRLELHQRPGDLRVTADRCEEEGRAAQVVLVPHSIEGVVAVINILLCDRHDHRQAGVARGGRQVKGCLPQAVRHQTRWQIDDQVFGYTLQACFDGIVKSRLPCSSPSLQSMYVKRIFVVVVVHRIDNKVPHEVQVPRQQRLPKGSQVLPLLPKLYLLLFQLLRLLPCLHPSIRGLDWPSACRLVIPSRQLPRTAPLVAGCWRAIAAARVQKPGSCQIAVEQTGSSVSMS